MNLRIIEVNKFSNQSFILLTNGIKTLDFKDLMYLFNLLKYFYLKEIVIFI